MCIYKFKPNHILTLYQELLFVINFFQDLNWKKYDEPHTCYITNADKVVWLSSLGTQKAYTNPKF